GLRQGGERRPALEARSLGVDEDRVEMIEVPERVVAPGVGLLPQLEHVRPGDALLAGLDAETDPVGRHVASSVGMSARDATRSRNLEPAVRSAVRCAVSSATLVQKSESIAEFSVLRSGVPCYVKPHDTQRSARRTTAPRSAPRTSLRARRGGAHGSA